MQKMTARIHYGGEILRECVTARLKITWRKGKGNKIRFW